MSDATTETSGPEPTEAAGSHRPLAYLSDGWLAAADRLLAGLRPVGAPVSVAVVVTGGPAGDRHYRLVLGPDLVGIDDRIDDAEVRMTLAWADAVSIAQGHSSAQRAFLAGRLRLGGDSSVLLGHQEALATVDDLLAPLRAETDWG